MSSRFIFKKMTTSLGASALLFFARGMINSFSPKCGWLLYQSGNLKNLYQRKGNSCSFEGDLKVEIILDQETKILIGWISDIILFFRARDYRQKYFKVLKMSLQAEVLQIFLGVIFIKNNCRQKYCKYIWRGGIYKPSVQAEEILQIFQMVEFINQNYRQKLQIFKETRVFSYTTYSQKYEPTEDEPRKDWKNLRLSGGNQNNSMDQIFISASKNGWNQCFYKRKS